MVFSGETRRVPLGALSVIEGGGGRGGGRGEKGGVGRKGRENGERGRENGEKDGGRNGREKGEKWEREGRKGSHTPCNPLRHGRTSFQEPTTALVIFYRMGFV